MATTRVKLKQLQPDGASTGGTIYFDGTNWTPQSNWLTNNNLSTALNTTINANIASLVRADPSWGQTEGIRSFTSGLAASPYTSFKSIIGQTTGSGDVYAFDSSVTTSSTTGRHVIRVQGGNSHSALVLTNASGTTDSYVAAITSSSNWAFGNDSSDSGAFVLCNAATVGSNNRLKIATGGQLFLPSYTSSSSFTGTVAGSLAFTSAGNIITTTPALTSLNTLTGGTQTFATGTSGSDFNISSASTTHTFNLPDAASSTRGVVSTSAQSFSGTKNFNALLSALAGIEVGVDNVTRGTIKLHSTGTGSVILQPSNSTTADYTLTFPTTDGDANQTLATDGAGVLTWATSNIFKTVSISNVTESNTASTSITAAGISDTVILNSNSDPYLTIGIYDTGVKQINFNLIPNFADGDFRVNSVGDNTKILAFNVGGFTTGTTRTATWPNKSGTVAFLDDVTGGTPAGSNTQIQYNNSGAFGASTNFEWVDASTRLDIGSPTSPGTSRIVVKGADTSGTAFAFQSFNSSDVERTRITNSGYYQGIGLSRIAFDYTSFFEANARLRQPFDNTFVDTSGTVDLFHQYSTFAPTSGTAVFNGLYINQQINQTGGANGITRGIFVDPVLTSSADYRAIETSSGKVIFGGTNAIKLPVGTTAQRVDVQGNIRYNTTVPQFEGYTGSAWVGFGGGGVTDGDKGDITVSSSGAIWTIDNDVVTYAKMQNVSATDRLLGRDTAGAGDVEELTVSGGIEFTGTGIQTSAFTGDVTKSAGGTVTTIATDAVTTTKILNGAVTDAKITSMAASKLTSGTLPSSFAFGTTAASTARINYSGGNPSTITSNVANETTIFSQDGEQYVSANNTSTLIGSGTTYMQYIDGVLRLYDSDLTHFIGITTPATGSLTTSYTLTLPVDDGTANQFLQTNGTGTLTWASGGSGDIVNGGNTGAVIIGTNDANTLSLETNNVVRAVFTGGASTGGALTLTDVSSNTSTVETNITKIVNSSGTATAGFGQRQLFQLESSTTNSQDAAAIDILWTTATHASRTADIVFSGVNNATALAETFRIAGNGVLTNTVSTSATNATTDGLILKTNSTGTAAAGFGGSILFQGETSTTNNTDQNRISSIWSTATHASRQSAIIFSTVTNAGALTELVRMDGRQMRVAGQYVSTKFALTDGATIALDWNNSNVQSVTLGGNRTFTFANPLTGGRYLIVLKQDATGSRTVTWPTVKWRGGTAPTLTTTANKTDLITLIWDGTDYFGDASLNF